MMMRWIYFTVAVSALTTAYAQQYDDYGDYQDYQDYASYQDGYGQEDNLYANYADRQAQKAV